MQAVMISIRPKWCKLIADGKKTIEVRRKAPRLQTPFKCYIYCTAGTGEDTYNAPISSKTLMEHYLDTGSMACLNREIGNGMVIGEFVCDKIICSAPGLPGNSSDWFADLMDGSCLTHNDLMVYSGLDPLFGWHISDLQIYEKPKPLSMFHNCLRCGYMGVCDGKCWNGMTTPPQSWCYVEELPDV